MWPTDLACVPSGGFWRIQRLVIESVSVGKGNISREFVCTVTTVLTCLHCKELGYCSGQMRSNVLTPWFISQICRQIETVILCSGRNLVGETSKFGKIPTFGSNMGQNRAEPVQTHVEPVQYWTIGIGSGSAKRLLNRTWPEPRQL